MWRFVEKCPCAVTLVVAVIVSLSSCRQEPPPVASVSTDSSVEAPTWSGIDLSGKALYSQSQEELIIRDFFRDRKNGVFLDVGCATPVIDSNTCYLERHLGWSGIAVDALPEYAESWKRRRPNSRFFNYLVTDHADGVEPFYRSELPGISSVKKPIKGPGGKERSFEEIQVPTITLTQLLEQNGISKIDFLTLDIEGAEPLALAGFDINRFTPQLVCIEAKPANREFIVKYCGDHGYEQIQKYLEYDRMNFYFERTVDQQ
jgi:FkbM family methyltransferase